MNATLSVDSGVQPCYQCGRLIALVWDVRVEEVPDIKQEEAPGE